MTTSWDDGHPLDFKLVKLLRKYGLSGTFYVAPKYEKREVLDENEIKLLSKYFEIGAHTLTHKDLTALSLREAEYEIVEGKKLLEEITGQRVNMFCYPKGRYNDNIVELVRKIGFLGARTVEELKINCPIDPHKMWTTIHAYPSSYKKYFGLMIRRKEYFNLLKRAKFVKMDWVRVAKYLFDEAMKKGGVFHLWGHSWEIEKFGIWEELEDVFEYISNRDVLYLSNGEVIKSCIS